MSPLKGKAWIRTNIGHIGVCRKEIIERIERGIPPLAQDWFDMPMRRIHDRLFQITLALTEIGHAEAKCFFLEDGKSDPEWPEGPNTVLNVGSAHTCCANIIYNAFVRQFGPNKAGNAVPHAEEQGWVHELDKAGYTVIPKSGTFRDLIAELDFICRKAWLPLSAPSAHSPDADHLRADGALWQSLCGAQLYGRGSGPGANLIPKPRPWSSSSSWWMRCMPAMRGS